MYPVAPNVLWNGCGDASCFGCSSITGQCIRTNDTDGDTICQTIDNCPTVPNPDQTDTDGDGVRGKD
jgi:hypothetical protein